MEAEKKAVEDNPEYYHRDGVLEWAKWAIELYRFSGGHEWYWEEARDTTIAKLEEELKKQEAEA